MAKTKFDKLNTIARCQLGLPSLEGFGVWEGSIEKLLSAMERAYDAGRRSVLEEQRELMDKLNKGWDCDKSPSGTCEYDDDPDHCIHCGEPSERK